MAAGGNSFSVQQQFTVASRSNAGNRLRRAETGETRERMQKGWMPLKMKPNWHRGNRHIKLEPNKIGDLFLRALWKVRRMAGQNDQR